MITPTDIQNKEFTRGVRGYNEKEVDMFLDLITLDLEKIVKENVRLKGEIAAQNEQIEKYKASEGEVIQVLEKAKALMNDISASTDKRAQVIIKNAEMEADLKIRNAEKKAEQLEERNAELEKSVLGFRDKYRRMLETELKNIGALADDFGIDETRPAQEAAAVTPAEDASEDTAGSGPDLMSEPDDDIIDVRDLSDLDDFKDMPRADGPADDRRTVVVDIHGGRE
ncbi:MAG: DivIVA domain-containing protein [Anaerovoracaceae bacterium]|nr:DivIVA domain-containing protein [Anaerovoracaceae bacterium]